MPDPVTPNADIPPSHPGAPGTMYPSLDGQGGPGDQPKSSDITGLVLNDLSPREDPLPSIGGGSSTLGTPSDPTPAAPGNQQVAGGDINPPVGRSRRSAGERIAQLTKKYRQEQNTRGHLETQLAQLVDKVQAQSHLIQNLRSGAPAPAQPAQSPEDPLGLGAGEPTAQPTSQPSVSANEIAGVVDQAIAKHFGQLRQEQAARSQLVSNHEASFREAATEFPELNDRGSRAFQLFDQLYDTSPLRPLPDAPYQIALQVRGILADEAQGARAPATVAARKAQASIVPVASSTPPPDVAGAAQVNNMVKEREALAHEMQLGNNDPRLYIRLRKLDRRISQSQGK